MKGKNIIIVQGHLDTKWKDWFEGMANQLCRHKHHAFRKY